MTARFGRNQKRKMREALEQVTKSAHEAEQAALRAKTTAQEAQARQRDAERQVEFAKHVLPRYSVAAPPEVRKFGDFGPRPPAVVFLEEQRAIGELGVTNHEQAMEEMTIRRTPLDVLVADIDIDPMTGDMHCLAKFGEGMPLAYAISRSAMRRMSPAHQVEQLSQAIARQIAHKVMEANRQGRRG